MNIVDAMEESSSLRIQKMMLLYCMCFDKKNPPYHFFPNIKGAYSLTLSDDYHALASKGFLSRSPEGCYTLSKNLSEDYSISGEARAFIEKLVRHFSGFSDKELTEFTYEKFPGYAIRSRILDTLNLSACFYRKRDVFLERIQSADSALYTIGYEGRSIDSFLSELMRNNVKYLFDVRKNALSMRYEFNKGYLKNALSQAGIEYCHFADVGIDADKRNELLPVGKREELFEWYSCNILPEKKGFASMIGDYLKAGNNVALMCYERDPADCHRSYLAEFCKQNNGFISKVFNI